ncbi:GGDEF domain-containing protein [Aquitalea sp. LB_tupeE]|uniref:GGDEF domain-containing protein n=1 Tax=Aquitalea sp. LB_tupeE TaxID=2748078 RepID=UPI0015B9C0D1|nr:GGDEF domain-containing protein [Aquitalea sp. LB_tupeE]NWK79914.1 GGDEF domain-containing protein [Aquitalea sp. LB_tupeE]
MHKASARQESGHRRLLAGLTSRLSRRLLLWIVCISALTALVSTSVQLFFDYRQDLSELEKGMRYIQQNQLPGLADAAWNFNVPGMQVQLEGIGHSPWVAGASLRYGPSLQATLETGKLGGKDEMAYRYPLLRHGVLVGQIRILPNLHTLYNRTIDRIVIVLVVQTIKSLITSICILLLISWMITHHLTQLARFAKSFRPDKRFKPFVLRRRAARQDELTVLVDSLNDAYARLQQAHEFEANHNEILLREVAERTAELREAQNRLARLAVTDKLTGAMNRQGLEERFAVEIQGATDNNTPLAIILMDIDNFKPVNDKWGHLIGDQVLQEFVAVLDGLLPAGSILARWGGEEFLILCPATTLGQATELAHYMCSRIAQHRFAVVNRKTGSFGVSAWHAGDSTYSLVKRADEALYRAKSTGRNRVCVEASPSTA